MSLHNLRDSPIKARTKLEQKIAAVINKVEVPVQGYHHDYLKQERIKQETAQDHVVSRHCLLSFL